MLWVASKECNLCMWFYGLYTIILFFGLIFLFLLTCTCKIYIILFFIRFISLLLLTPSFKPTDKKNISDDAHMVVLGSMHMIAFNIFLVIFFSDLVEYTYFYMFSLKVQPFFDFFCKICMQNESNVMVVFCVFKDIIFLIFVFIFTVFKEYLFMLFKL